MLHRIFKQHFILIAAFMMITPSASAAEQARLALVIGNGAYTQAPPLSNPANDARDMAAMLERFGFDVILKTDVPKRDMVEALREFGQRLTDGAVALFYFSGHGLQSQNLNYLLPLKANIQAELDIEFEAFEANRVLAVMEGANARGVNIIILDACRSNPYKSYMKSAEAGLAIMNSPAGSLLAFATAPGTVAYADNTERNSIYTKHLLAALRDMPNTDIKDVFMAVRNRVLQDTERRQNPWESTSLTQRFCFGGCAATQIQPLKPQAEIADLLNACERHFQANRLTSGRGGTALECYEAVLEMDPANADALAGLEKIEAQYADWALAALDRGDTAKARQYLASWRIVNPESLELEALARRLDAPDGGGASETGPSPDTWNQGVWGRSRWQ